MKRTLVLIAGAVATSFAVCFLISAATNQNWRAAAESALYFSVPLTIAALLLFRKKKP